MLTKRVGDKSDAHCRQRQGWSAISGFPSGNGQLLAWLALANGVGVTRAQVLGEQRYGERLGGERERAMEVQT